MDIYLKPCGKTEEPGISFPPLTWNCCVILLKSAIHALCASTLK